MQSVFHRDGPFLLGYNIGRCAPTLEHGFEPSPTAQETACLYRSKGGVDIPEVGLSSDCWPRMAGISGASVRTLDDGCESPSRSGRGQPVRRRDRHSLGAQPWVRYARLVEANLAGWSRRTSRAGQGDFRGRWKRTLRAGQGGPRGGQGEPCGPVRGEPSGLVEANLAAVKASLVGRFEANLAGWSR